MLLADTDADLRPALLRILEEFRRRYVLTYVPEGVEHGGWHALDVSREGPAGQGDRQTRLPARLAGVTLSPPRGGRSSRPLLLPLSAQV